MKGHPQYLELINYLENEVTEQESQKIREHLESCDKCSHFMRDFIGISRLIERKSKKVKLKPSQKVFTQAYRILDERKEQTEKRRERINQTLERVRTFEEKVNLGIQALGAGSVALILMVILSQYSFKKKYVEVFNNEIEVLEAENQ